MDEGARLEAVDGQTSSRGSDPLSAILITISRARRGGSGALYLQPAIAGSMPPRLFIFRACRQGADGRSCAAKLVNPVRSEGSSGKQILRVLQGAWSGRLSG